MSLSRRPGGGNGPGQTFTATYNYPGGLGGSEAALLVQSALVNGLRGTYDLNTQALWIVNDAAIGGPAE
jgi:hypothetical protein